MLAEHWKVDKKLLKGLDTSEAERTVRGLLSENYIKKKRPISTRLGIKYTRIPIKLRNFLFKILRKFKRDPGFPRWPIEDYLENINFKFLLKLKERNGEVPYIKFWPKHEFAFVITHDMDTESSFENIEKIRAIERKYGFQSSWNVLAGKYEIDFEKLEKLKKERCEIGCHGYNHDGTLSFIDIERIEARIKYCKDKLKKFSVKGFRSPQLQKSDDMLEVVSKNFDYDSSMADTDVYSVVGMRSGCCSVFPYMLKNMVELPLTMPQDYRLLYTLNLSDEEILDVWKRKIDFIKRRGGLVLINAHPDSYLTGSERGLLLYDKILEYMSKQKVYHALAKDLAKWWKERDSCEISGKRIIGSKRARIEIFK